MIRDFEKFKELAKDSKILFKEAEYNKSVNPPFAVYFRTGERRIYSDSLVVETIVTVIIELYTAKGDEKTEKAFEKWLSDNEILTKKTGRTWVTEEKFYCTIYEAEMIEFD